MIKINNGSEVKESLSTESVDINEIFSRLQQTNKQVFISQIQGQTFFYRAVGRGEYKTILTDERFNDMEKEELICQISLLWPENYDFDEGDAGIPTRLVKEIIKNSLLDSLETRNNVLVYYRNEMWNIDYQISCIIHEAFPEYDIEEIEDWGVDKTTKMLTKAEWILQNLRGVQVFNEDIYGVNQVAQKNAEPEKKEAKSEDTIRGGKKSNKLTPEKMQELAEMRRKFPEINWNDDAVMNNGIEGLENAEAMDTTSPALRVGS